MFYVRSLSEMLSTKRWMRSWRGTSACSCWERRWHSMMEPTRSVDSRASLLVPVSPGTSRSQFQYQNICWWPLKNLLHTVCGHAGEQGSVEEIRRQTYHWHSNLRGENFHWPCLMCVALNSAMTETGLIFDDLSHSGADGICWYCSGSCHGEFFPWIIIG